MVVAAELGVKGIAGFPTVASWWKASSSAVVIIAIWSLESALSWTR